MVSPVTAMGIAQGGTMHRDLARQRRRAKVWQHELAEEMEISVASVIRFERKGYPLPWEKTPADYLDGVKRVADRKRRAKEEGTGK